MLSIRDYEGIRTERERCVLESEYLLMHLSAAFLSEGEKPASAPTAEHHTGNQSLYLVNDAEAFPMVGASLFSPSLGLPVHPLPWMTTAVEAGVLLKGC